MTKELRSVFIEPDVIAKVRELAVREDRPFSAMVRRLLDEALAARQKEQQ